MAGKVRVLFVSQGNPTRLHMAVGFARHYGGSLAVVDSAGSGPDSIDQYCQWAMNETAIDIADQNIGNLTNTDLSSYTHIVTIGEGAREALVSAAPRAKLEHWGIPDPASVRARPDELIRAYRSVRNKIETRVKELLQSALGK
jgi:arsenate reductase